MVSVVFRVQRAPHERHQVLLGLSTSNEGEYFIWSACNTLSHIYLPLVMR